MPANARLQILTSVLGSHRIFLYSVFSTVAVSAVIANALQNHSNFYSVAIDLSNSSRSVLVLANFGFIIALLCGRVVQRIFFGPLRAPEVERLYDRLWFFVTESLLAFTIFRDEFDIPFALMFGFLLFVKSFHWLASDRIEWMDQRPYPGPPVLFHIRMNALFMILWLTDLAMFAFAIESVSTHGVGGMVLFASEYAILMASALNTVAKYLLSVYELRRASQRGGENAPQWDDKSMWVFYIELVTDFLKLTTYLAFFTLIITFYGLPLNILRDVYITARSFITRLRALHRYQTATRNMDQRYPNATEQEMTAMSDRTCIICREEMILPAAASANGDTAPGQQAPTPGQPQTGTEGPNVTPKKLPCGHIFHFHCLRSWLERQQSCPTCRRTVLDPETPQAGATGARPAQPGGALPQPNGAPGLGQPNPQPLANNLFNRFLGLQQPPVPQNAPAPGGPMPQHAQFMPPLPQGQQLPGTLGWIPVHQQPGVTIHLQYHVQGQPGAQTQLPQPTEPLQPVPAFRGFRGPGGVWQPWGANEGAIPPQVQTEQANGHANGHANGYANGHANGDASSGQQPTPTHSQPGAVDGAEVGSAGADGSTNPREAAALAAMRRMAKPVGGASAASSSGPTPSNLPASSSSPNGAAGSSAAAGSSQGLPDIPTMIPLFDPMLYQSPSTSNTGGLIPSAPSTQATSTTFTLPTETSSRNEPLPPNLTDEQLVIMDSLTREAIDERLRVLEGVSGSLYRCIDDLMRMRSALPPLVPTPAPATASRSSSDSSVQAPVTDEMDERPQQVTS